MAAATRKYILSILRGQKRAERVRGIVRWYIICVTSPWSWRCGDQPETAKRRDCDDRVSLLRYERSWALVLSSTPATSGQTRERLEDRKLPQFDPSVTVDTVDIVEYIDTVE